MLKRIFGKIIEEAVDAAILRRAKEVNDVTQALLNQPKGCEHQWSKWETLEHIKLGTKGSDGKVHVVNETRIILSRACERCGEKEDAIRVYKAELAK